MSSPNELKVLNDVVKGFTNLPIIGTGCVQKGVMQKLQNGKSYIVLSSKEVPSSLDMHIHKCTPRPIACICEYRYTTVMSLHNLRDVFGAKLFLFLIELLLKYICGFSFD